MYYLNQKIENLVRIFDQNERKSYLRLDLNENPGGLPEEFVNGVLGDVTPQLIAQYPETLHFTEVLAQYLGTDIQHLCLVNGSAEGIRYIIQAFTSENGKIVGVVPSYFMFQVYSEMYGRNFVKVPYNKDLTMSIENIITQLTDDTQLLILLNPNNPMGNVYTDEEFKTIMQVCKEKQITVLISSHILTEIEHIADTIGIIKDGTIVREVSMAELKSESPSGLEDYFMDIMTGRKENEKRL